MSYKLLIFLFFACTVMMFVSIIQAVTATTDLSKIIWIINMAFSMTYGTWCCATAIKRTP